MVFVLTSCLAMPLGVVALTVPDYLRLFRESPRTAVDCALLFGFAWASEQSSSAALWTGWVSRWPTRWSSA
jgi:hypothetical protein